MINIDVRKVSDAQKRLQLGRLGQSTSHLVRVCRRNSKGAPVLATPHKCACTCAALPVRAADCSLTVPGTPTERRIFMHLLNTSARIATCRRTHRFQDLRVELAGWQELAGSTSACRNAKSGCLRNRLSLVTAHDTSVAAVNTDCLPEYATHGQNCDCRIVGAVSNSQMSEAVSPCPTASER